MIWLASHDCLPINVFRKACHLTQSDICPMCGSLPETILHCLKDCDYACSVWNNLGFHTVLKFYGTNLSFWLYSNGIGRNAFLFLAGLWFIWRARNSLVFDLASINIYSLCRKISHIADLCASSLSKVQPHQDELWVAWSPPHSFFI